MADPRFLDSSVFSFYYHQSTGVTDVTTVISDTRTGLVTNLGWTEPTTALFKSVPDAAGKWFDVLLTRISATNLELRVRDHRGATLITRRIQIDGAGTVINYFFNVQGMLIESNRATIEVAQAHLLDPVQVGDLVHESDVRIVANAYRTSADTAEAAGIATGSFFAFDSGAAVNASRAMYGWAYGGGVLTGNDGASTLHYKDVLVNLLPLGFNVVTGVIPQMVICDSSIAFGTDKTVPRNQGGTTVTMRTVGLTTTANTRIACRKA